MRTLIVSAAKAGHVNQCLAVCERLGWTGADIVSIPSAGRMDPALTRRKLRVLGHLATLRARPRRRQADRLRIVASGAAAETIVASYRALYGADLFAVFSGRPGWPSPIFDLVLAPRHALSAEERAAPFASPAARFTVLRRGVPVRSEPPQQRDRAGVFAMIGGVNKAFRIEASAIARQVEELLGQPEARPFTMTFSRRTPDAVEAELRTALATKDVRFVDRDDRGGFEEALAGAARYVITPDSLSMICEACDTGRPVQIFDLACFDPGSSTARCVRDLIDGGDVALAPYGAPLPGPPGGFRVPQAVVEAYRDWEAARDAAT